MYVDAFFDRQTETIYVAERINGKRKIKTDKPTYQFYFKSEYGNHKSIHGDKLELLSTTNKKTFFTNKKKYKYDDMFEVDINPLNTYLSQNYLMSDTPKLNIGFFDIEVDFDPDLGYAPTSNPFNKITAITVYTTSDETAYTLVLKPELPKNDPDYLTFDQAEKICNEFDNTLLCIDEEELLNRFIDLIDDVDVLSGWNSKGYDIPYIINRMKIILGEEEIKRLCLFDQYPRPIKYSMYKKEHQSYELIGRVHLDYMDLYKKNNPKEMPSYKLDYIGKVEVGENKVAYDGTLDNLYKRDFKKFIEYNRQDTVLLNKIDKKRKYIELANQVAHTNTVLLPATVKSVALIEQAITNEAHERGMIIPSRKETTFDDYFDSDVDDLQDDKDLPVVGAYVAKPIPGIYHEIACCDINSLYPSAIRALNMSPETLFGQVRSDYTEAFIRDRISKGMKGPDAWENIFATLEYDMIINKTDDLITIDFENGEIHTEKAKDWYNFIFGKESFLNISANGTLFRKDFVGLIPGLLTKWYTERKVMQARETQWNNMVVGLELSDETIKNLNNVQCSNDETDIGKLEKYINDGKYDFVKSLMSEHNLIIADNKLHAVDKELAKYNVGFWNQRQQARKILLNSLYGAILNDKCKFYDARIGQSVTLTGRSITKHMMSHINEQITNDYTPFGGVVKSGDTDSVYFTVYEYLKGTPEFDIIFGSRENTIRFYDEVGHNVNESFPEFMKKAFNTSIEDGAIIKAGRELVASSGLFIKRKRYGLMVYDMDGFRLDVDGKPGKMKMMGLDLKRSDTPMFMQTFLEDILKDVLTGMDKSDILLKIKDFRNEFREMKPWEIGSPKKVNGYSDYCDKLDTANQKDFLKRLQKKITIPGHVRAAMNWNMLKEHNNDKYSSYITDGSRVIVCSLKKNNFGFNSIAYPYDDDKIPEWFKQLSFDFEKMEEIVFDKKIENLLGTLNWDLESTKQNNTFDDIFSWN